jgi:hypothetical protein
LLVLDLSSKRCEVVLIVLEVVSIHYLKLTTSLSIEDHNASTRLYEVVLVSTSDATCSSGKGFETFRFNLIVTDFADHNLY